MAAEKNEKRKGIDRRAFLSAAAAATIIRPTEVKSAGGPTMPEKILYNGKVTTLDQRHVNVTALAIGDGHIMSIGDDRC